MPNAGTTDRRNLVMTIAALAWLGVTVLLCHYGVQWGFLVPGQ
jgi:hypothetical protein